MQHRNVQLISSFVVLLIQLGTSSPRGLFTDDKDIENFLRLYNTDVMLWSCKNGIDFKYKTLKYDNVLASISLKCDVLGVPSSIRIEHNFSPVKGNGKRYQLLVGPHFEGSKMFYDWKEYTLKILNPTAADNGLYRIFVRGPSGKTQQQLVYVNLKRYEPLLAKVRAKNRSLQKQRAGNPIKGTIPYLPKQIERPQTTEKAKVKKEKPKDDGKSQPGAKSGHRWVEYRV